MKRKRAKGKRAVKSLDRRRRAPSPTDLQNATSFVLTLARRFELRRRVTDVPATYADRERAFFADRENLFLLHLCQAVLDEQVCQQALLADYARGGLLPYAQCWVKNARAALLEHTAAEVVEDLSNRIEIAFKRLGALVDPEAVRVAVARELALGTDRNQGPKESAERLLAVVAGVRSGRISQKRARVDWPQGDMPNPTVQVEPNEDPDFVSEAAKNVCFVLETAGLANAPYGDDEKLLDALKQAVACVEQRLTRRRDMLARFDAAAKDPTTKPSKPAYVPQLGSGVPHSHGRKRSR